MARKHDKFTYSYGWRTAPEQWNFFWNDKLIRLNNDTRSTVASLMLSGKKTEAEAILKRELRKQEKEESYICIGFFGKNSKQFYFTQQLRCRRDNLKEKLYAYKEWKHYIEMRGSDLALSTVTSGYMQADGKMSDGKAEKSKNIVDLNRPCIIKLVKPMEKRVFQF
jgi:hypothetical protein